jgi:CHRD domain
MAIVTSYNLAFVTANGGTAATAEAALLSGMMDGKSYLNLHTSVFPGGEIRGFLAPAVPEPTSLMIWSLFGLAVGAGWWRRRKQAA